MRLLLAVIFKCSSILYHFISLLIIAVMPVLVNLDFCSVVLVDKACRRASALLCLSLDELAKCNAFCFSYGLF